MFRLVFTGETVGLRSIVCAGSGFSLRWDSGTKGRTHTIRGPDVLTAQAASTLSIMLRETRLTALHPVSSRRPAVNAVAATRDPAANNKE
jgi:hypothetical protein